MNPSAFFSPRRTDMSFFYVVSGIGGGFDGLVVEGSQLKDLPPTVEIRKIIDRDSVVGDRNVTLSLPDGALFIGSQFLTPTPDPGNREFGADSPYGKFQLEGRMDCGNLRVAYAQFEKVLQVTVTDVPARKTIASMNFLREFDKIKSAIEDVLKSGGQDGEDLVFKLREFLETENNG